MTTPKTMTNHSHVSKNQINKQHKGHSNGPNPPNISSTANTTMVPAIDRMCQIMDLITISSYPLTSAEIAESLQLPRSSTHNILQSLLTKHLVLKDRDNRFHLGSYLLYWAGKYEQQHSIIQLFYDRINQHPTLLNHTVTLSKIDHKDVVYLACHESPAPLGFTFHAGVRVPAPFSATGKAMLATLDDHELENRFNDGLPEPLTRYSVTTLDALKKELVAIRESGVSLDNGQIREGMYCLGTCIRDAQGKPVAGMAVSFIKQEFAQNKDAVGQALMALADDISKALGVSDESILFAAV